MCVSRVEDEWEMMGMTMGMNRDGIRWAQDEHERGMNVIQPCMAMHGHARMVYNGFGVAMDTRYI